MTAKQEYLRRLKARLAYIEKYKKNGKLAEIMKIPSDKLSAKTDNLISVMKANIAKLEKEELKIREGVV